MGGNMEIVQIQSEEQIALARELFREYAASLGVDLCFQNFEQELAELPGAYALPNGRLLLAFHDKELAGCIALPRSILAYVESEALRPPDVSREAAPLAEKDLLALYGRPVSAIGGSAGKGTNASRGRYRRQARGPQAGNGSWSPGISLFLSSEIAYSIVMS